MNYKPQQKKTKIMLGIPTYDRRVDMELMMLYGVLKQENKYDLHVQFTANSIITKSRNYICQSFLDNKFDYLLFIDSDVVPKDLDFIDLLFETVYKLDAQIVGGCYLTKDDSGKYGIANGKLDTGWRNFGAGELTEPRLVDFIKTGLMLIQKIVLQTINPPWFEMIDKTPTLTIPEDWVFCHKAREQGFKIAIDPRIKTVHYGQYGWVHDIYV